MIFGFDKFIPMRILAGLQVLALRQTYVSAAVTIRWIGFIERSRIGRAVPDKGSVVS